MNNSENQERIAANNQRNKILLVAELNFDPFSQDNENPILSLQRLRQQLADIGYLFEYTDHIPNDIQLTKIAAIILRQTDNDDLPVEALKQFITNGGGLLLISDAGTPIALSPPFKALYTTIDLKFNEYLNILPRYLQRFSPHYVTANLRRVRVDKIIAVQAKAQNVLATTKATRTPVIAYATVGQGRVIAMGDSNWLTDQFIQTESNQQLATNIFSWLTRQNVIDIESLTIPKEVTWGDTATVVLKLRNNHTDVRPTVTCTLESDADATITKTASKSRSIPPNMSTQMQWKVHPQILGQQYLRLSIHVEGYSSLFFDKLPELNCLASGYFTLEIKDKSDKLKTDFATGETIFVEAAFHWTSDVPPLPHQLELRLSQGLIEKGYGIGNGVKCWQLQATTSGEHELQLRMVETGQALPAVITAQSSFQERLNEIKAAYVYPLDAEIAERLRQLDERFTHLAIQARAFDILSPTDFVQKLYTGYAETWLMGVLAAAKREQWSNSELIDLLLEYISPTYLIDYGSLIPYEPHLASRLAQLHPEYRRYLEYNLLCSLESDGFQIKQNIAAYLLHEKYGHGFFYTQTQLGQQLILLQKHAKTLPITQLVNDSATVVNEGFAAWLELSFLKKLDREVRQAYTSRHILLMEEGRGLYDRVRQENAFFVKFRPQFDSRYREGFEYLQFIEDIFNTRCVIHLFLMATAIDLGVRENEQKQIELDVNSIQYRLLEADSNKWRSHLRLRTIAETLRDTQVEAKIHIRESHCPIDCQSYCPLETFIVQKTQWQKYYE